MFNLSLGIIPYSFTLVFILVSFFSPFQNLSETFLQNIFFSLLVCVTFIVSLKKETPLAPYKLTLLAIVFLSIFSLFSLTTSSFSEYINQWPSAFLPFFLLLFSLLFAHTFKKPKSSQIILHGAFLGAFLFLHKILPILFPQVFFFFPDNSFYSPLREYINMYLLLNFFVCIQNPEKKCSHTLCFLSISLGLFILANYIILYVALFTLLFSFQPRAVKNTYFFTLSTIISSVMLVVALILSIIVALQLYPNTAVYAQLQWQVAFSFLSEFPIILLISSFASSLAFSSVEIFLLGYPPNASFLATDVFVVSWIKLLFSFGVFGILFFIFIYIAYIIKRFSLYSLYVFLIICYLGIFSELFFEPLLFICFNILFFQQETDA